MFAFPWRPACVTEATSSTNKRSHTSGNAAESLALRAMALMRQVYKDLPRGFWGLNKAADLLCPRVVVLTHEIPPEARGRLFAGDRFPIVGVRTGEGYNEEITSWPPGVQFITIGPDFMKDTILPEGVKVVEFHSSSLYCQCFRGIPKVNAPNGGHSCWNGYLPASLESLICKGCFNKPLLDMRQGFRDPTVEGDLTSRLPNKLQRLTLGDKFTLPLGSLPQTLLSLTLGEDFNQPLGPLPKGLKKLELGLRFSHALGDLPPGLLYLRLGRDYKHPLGQLPEALHTLVTGGYRLPLGPLPPRLHTLKMIGGFNHPLGQLPETLRRLHLGSHFTQPLGPLPPNLHTLELEDIGVFNLPLGPLPESLRILDVSNNEFDQPLGQLPQKLKSLIVNNYTTPLENLPYTLYILMIGMSPTHLDPLPPNLRQLTARMAKHIGRLPETLKFLSINESATYDGPLPKGIHFHTFDDDEGVEETRPRVDAEEIGEELKDEGPKI